MFTYLFGVSRRWEMALLLFSGVMIVYTLRVNMSVAAPKMRDDLAWSEKDKGFVLSAFYWGYALGQIPAVLYAKVYGGKMLFGLSILIPSVLTLFVPVAAEASLGWALCLRGLIGFFESASFPAVFYFLPIWIPQNEKTILIPTIYSGMYLGEIIGFSASGYLVESVVVSNGFSLGGWPSVFYVFGLAGIAWFPFWVYFAYESPSQHPCISPKELELIQNSYSPLPVLEKNYHSITGDDYNGQRISSKDKVPSYQPIPVSEEATKLTPLLPRSNQSKHSLDFMKDIPWTAIFTNKASLTNFTCSWVFGFIGFMLLSEMPSYLTEHLKFDLQSAGLLCIAPYAGQFAVTLGVGALFDHLQSAHGWKARSVRQCAQFIAFGGSGGLLLLSGFIDSKYPAFVLVTIAQALLGASQSGLGCVFLEVAPRYSSILNTIGNTIGAVAGIVGPILVALFIDTWQGVWGWRAVFILTACMCAVALTLWANFQTSDIIPELNTPVTYVDEDDSELKA